MEGKLSPKVTDEMYTKDLCSFQLKQIRGRIQISINTSSVLLRKPPGTYIIIMINKSLI